MTRISSIPKLGQCPGFAVFQAAEERGPSRAPADSGSMVGRIIELFHRNGEHAAAYEEAVAQAMREVSERFPAADLDEARAISLAYASDPVNRGVVVGAWCELEVALSLAPAPEDSTGTPIELLGHVDQIRRTPTPDVFRVWDVKNGKPGGLEILYSYAWQLAAYALASTETLTKLLGRPITVLPGGIIRTKSYAPKRRTRNKETGELEEATPQPFYEAPWSLAECRGMLDSAAFMIAQLRNGVIPLLPGVQCQWCPAGGPNLCADKLSPERLPSIPKSLTT